MEKKPKFLKNLLTTASAIAVIAGGLSSTALGATHTTTGTPADLHIGGVSDNGLLGFAANDVLKIGVAGNVVVNAGSAVGPIEAIEVAFAGANFVDNKGMTIGAIGAAGNTMTLNVNGAVTTTLIGTASGDAVNAASSNVVNQYDGLGDVTLTGVGATLAIAPAAPGAIVLGGNIAGAGAGQGILTITNDGNTTTFNGTIGAGVGSLAAINIGAPGAAASNTAILKGTAIKATTITLHADLAAAGGPHASTLTLDSTNGAQTVTGAIDATAATNGGTSVLNFIGANGTTVTGAIGTTAPLTAINLGVANGATAYAAKLEGAAIKATTITLHADLAGATASTLTLDSTNGAQTVTGAIDATAATNGGTSVLNFIGANGTTVTGAIGTTAPLTAINLGVANGATAYAAKLEGAAIKATTITLHADLAGATASTLTLDSTNGAQTVTGAIDATAATNGGTSVLNFIGANGTTVTGAIGTTAPLTAINLGVANGATAYAAKLEGAAIKATTITLHADLAGATASTLTLDSTNGAQTVTGAIDATAATNGGTSVLNFIGANGTTVTGAIGTTAPLTAINLGVANGATAYAAKLEGAAIKATTITLHADLAGATASTLTLDSTNGAQTVTGAIDATAATNGGTSVLNFIGANGTTVTGAIGTTAPLTAINLGVANGATAYAAKLEGAAIKATTITLHADLAGATASTLTLDSTNGAQTVTGAIDATAATNGGTSVLNFIGANGTTVTGAIGTTAPLTAINLGVANGATAYAAKLEGAAIKATTITLHADLAGATASTLTLDSTNGAQTVTGAIDATAATNGGTSVLNFIGANGTTVTGAIGTTAPLTAINLGVANGATAYAAKLEGAAIKATTITLHADLAGATASTLTLDSTNGAQTVTGAIDATAATNGGTSVLNFIGANGTTVTGAIGTTAPLTAINVKALATATLSDAVVNATTITIGEVVNTGTLIRGGNVNFDLNPGAAVQTVFANADSVLKLQSTAGAIQTVTVQNHVDPGANKGIIELHTQGAGSQLVITGGAAGKTLGTAINKLKELKVTSTGTNTESVTIAGGANAVNLANIDVLNIKRGAVLWNKSGTAAVTTNIGEAGGGGAAGLALDATEADLALLNGTAINFVNADSKLMLGHNNAGANRTITLHGNLVGGADDKGIVVLMSKQAGKQLIIDSIGGAQSIGQAAGNRFKNLVIKGLGDTVINTKVYAKTLTLDGGNVNFTAGIDQGTNSAITVNNSTIVCGNIGNTGGNATITLGKNALTYQNGIAAFSGNVVINTTIDQGVGVGHIVIDGGVGAANLNLAGVQAITINVDGTSNINDIGQSYPLLQIVNAGTITPPAGVAPALNNNDLANPKPAWAYNAATAMLSNHAGGGGDEDEGDEGDDEGDNDDNNEPKPEDLNPKQEDLIRDAIAKTMEIAEFKNKTNAYVGYTVDAGGNLIPVNKIKAGLEKDFGKTNPGIVTAFAGVNVHDNSDASDVVNELGKLSITDPERQKKMADGLSVAAPTAAVATVTTGLVQAAQSAIGARMDNVAGGAGNNFKVSEGLGVAAGDELSAERYGIWGTPFYAQSTQKKKGSTPGYKSKAGGGTIGFDCLANDNLTLGLAFTAISTKLDHKNQKAGDTTKVESTLFSIYGAQQLPSNLFVQGIVSFGSSRVRNYEKRIINLTLDQTALGKYNSTSYSGEVLGGYRYILPDTHTVLTPMLGLRYAKFNDSGYTETGTTRRNMNVSKKSVDKIEGIIGGRASFQSQIKEVLLMPEVHGFVNYDFKGKAPKVEARLGGASAPMPTKASKPEKTFVNLGTSLTIKYRMMEYGFGYDANLAKKYVGHQGTLKIRVNF
ncbi:beta strand repeat-containing protein [Candidatus Trichorickettsia mobilis]|uniref:beta strand repeat-containing protein n=1 Tax=Candidatus Trichorickettsia mobilis TaxID=1346319 RepID=UPI00292E26C1|nr:autotransporter domain-containing protein [Candidatus Trichorickettsia mobilis]